MATLAKEGASTGTTLTARTLGGLEIEIDGQRIDEHIPAKAAALVAYLADSGGSATRTRLAGLLWSDQPEDRARANLRVALTRLRSEVGTHLDSDRRSVRLVGTIDHDAIRLSGASSTELAEMYRGDFLAGIEFDDAPVFDDWVSGRRSQLRHVAVEGLIDAAAEAEEAGDWERCLQTAVRAMEIDAVDERAHRLGIRAALRSDGRSAALARHRACVELVERELGLDPEPETLELAREIESGSIGGALDRSRLATGLERQGALGRLVVPPTPFFGRVEELERIERLIDNGARIVSLVGPGGAGKTRLAERAADRLRPRFTDQVVVELQGVNDGGRVAAVVSGVCGVSTASPDPLVDLIDRLDGAPLLLVIDNADEVAKDVGALCAHLTARCPSLLALVTSRVALDVSVEHLVPVDGLAIDSDPDAASAPIALFVERAQRFDPAIAPDDDVRSVCELVGGLPLAIELAARWVGAMSVSTIAERLREGIGLLQTDAADVPERQRSVRRVLDLTWAELEPRHQQQMSRLAVFRGGFDIAGAEAVTGATPVDLQHLATRSLLRRVSGGRFEMHELIRQHAVALLAANDDARDRHAEWILDSVVDARADLVSAWSARAVQRLGHDFDNIVAAWNHTVEHDDLGRLLSVAPPLSVFAVAALRDSETAELFRRAAARADGMELGCMVTHELAVTWRRNSIAASSDLYERGHAALTPSAPTVEHHRWHAVLTNLYATALTEQGGNPAESLALAEGALEQARSIGDLELIAELELTAGRAQGLCGRFGESEALLLSASEGFERLGNAWGAADTDGLLAATYAEQYRVWDALRADRSALALGLTRGDAQAICTAYANLGSSMVLVGAWGEAHEHTTAALELALEQRDPLFAAYLRCQLGEIAVGLGDREVAETSFERGIGGLRAEEYQIGLRLKLPEWARLLAATERWVEAGLVLDEAIEVCERLGGDHFVVTVDALRARWMLGSGHEREAVELAHDVWERIRSTGGRGLPHPIVAMADCVAVFDCAGDPVAAAEVRALAVRRVREVAADIDEPTYRRSYLDQSVVADLTGH
ncbi:MAG: BTAD domain-containing putative transcriptional regulator [Ilumatobacter sp.]